MDLLIDDFYLDEITVLYQNYLDKFKSDDICFNDGNLVIDDCILCECQIVDSCSDESLIFPFEDDIFDNRLPSPNVYLNDLIKEKVDFNFKGISNFRLDRSYLNRILKGNIPSKNTLVCIGYFLGLNLEEMSELFNVYGFAFGNSLDDRVIYHAFKNGFSYYKFLELVDIHGSNSLNKFFTK